jgi:ribosomal protein L11
VVESCIELKTFASRVLTWQNTSLCSISDLVNLKVGAGLGVLNSSLDPVLESVAVNRHDHVDLLKVLSARLQGLLVSVDVTVARAGRSSIDIKVD